MVFESLGRAAYILLIVLSSEYSISEEQLAFPLTLLGVLGGLQIGMCSFDYYGKQQAKGIESRSKTVTLLIGVLGFVGSLIAMVDLSGRTEHMWNLWVMYFIHLALSLAYSCPPVHLNIHGVGSIILFLMNGIATVELVTLALNIGWSLQAILECIPSHLLLQASLIVRELSSMKEDTKITTTAGLLGRHDSFRFVVLMHVFAFLFVLVDFAALSFSRGLPLVLIVWSLPSLYSLRHFQLSGLWKSYYRLFLTFTLLYSAGIMMENPQFLSDLEAKF